MRDTSRRPQSPQAGAVTSLRAANGTAELTELSFPARELSNDMLIEDVRLSTRIRNALKLAGIKTVGYVREAPDGTLLSFPNLGRSVAHLRASLGGP